MIQSATSLVPTVSLNPIVSLSCPDQLKTMKYIQTVLQSANRDDYSLFIAKVKQENPKAFFMRDVINWTAIRSQSEDEIISDLESRSFQIIKKIESIKEELKENSSN